MRKYVTTLLLVVLLVLCLVSASQAHSPDVSVSSFNSATYGELNVFPPYARYVVTLKLKKQACAIAAFAVDAQTTDTVNVDAVLCDKRGKALGANYATFFPLIKVTPAKADTYILVISNPSRRPIILSCKVN